MQKETKAPQLILVPQLGRYEIIGELGRGAMGIVYKARDPLIERTVAIKSVNAGMSQAEADAFERRFYREAKSAGRLNHPNIVTIHDVGKSGDHAYIAMEFLEGQSLREILDSGVVLPLDLVADIAAQVADGLAFAHLNEIVHRDIKPANIMVLYNGMVKITDFGIALLPAGSATMAGAIFGSPKYISPEQVVGKDVDGRSDIFALGAVLYEMLTGVPPFNGSDLNAILYQVINEMPPPPSSRSRRITRAFDFIVVKAMAKHPNERYQTVQEMAADLRSHGKLALPSTIKTPDPKHTLERRSSKRPKSSSSSSGSHSVRSSGGATIRTNGHETVQIDAVKDASSTSSKSAVVKKSSRSGSSSKDRKLVQYSLSLVLLLATATLIVLRLQSDIPDAASEKVSANSKNIETPQGRPAVPPTQPLAIPSSPGIGPQESALVPPGASPIPSSNLGQANPATKTGPSIEKSLGATAPLPSSAETNKTPKAKTEKPATPTLKADSSKRSNAQDGKKTGARATATVGFAVTPWGEIFVDGSQEGISPPLKELNLPPGKHIIEIRNSNFAPHKETIDLAPDANVKIKHKFQ